jgi:GrpB-like predicted nucleotidyltransferase (UPF0157 family)
MSEESANLDLTASEVAGAGDGPIHIARYDARWPHAFRTEAERISPLLGGVEIHHIGSTAVPGLSAKPVIDMMALVEDIDAMATTVCSSGYELPADFNRGLINRRYLCHPHISNRTHHLHVVESRQLLEDCLQFRDKLRADSQLARAYEALKYQLAERFQADRHGYTDAKSAFIESAIAPK